MAKKPTRLRFTEDDLADKAVRQAADRAEKAVGKAEKAVEKASKPKKKLRTEADVSKARSSKLRFDKAEIEPELDKPSRGKHMISRASSAAIASKAHQAVSEHEDDNVGVQAVHQSEEAVEAAAYMTIRIRSKILPPMFSRSRMTFVPVIFHHTVHSLKMRSWMLRKSRMQSVPVVC